MAKQNAALISFNRGLISPKAIARVDLDRTRLSAEVYNNWVAKTQGAMTLRPGTKYCGSSLNDTGAEFIEFVAATDDVALCELTHNKMRLWLGTDAHDLTLLSRPLVDTTLTLSDTGWSDTSTGGAFITGSSSDVIPVMTGATTNGVTITASSQETFHPDAGDCSAWKAADDTLSQWRDTGNDNYSLPSWWNVDFGADTGNKIAVYSYSIQCPGSSSDLPNAPKAWTLISSNYDTGTYASDTGKWTLVDARSGQTGWSVAERRTFTSPEGDTGTIDIKRHWRLNFTENNGPGPFGNYLLITEIEMFSSASSKQTYMSGGKLYLNSTSIGSLARREKLVVLSDTGFEHSLNIIIERGPVTLRVGSSQRDDDYISETSLGTGYHNLAFTPQGNFWVTLQHDGLVDRIVSSCTIGDSGTVEITTPWEAADLENIRYDQSADVVYVDCVGEKPKKIERRGTGRSWSVVDYDHDDGPFLPTTSSSAKLSVSHFFGNTTLNSDIPFFTQYHVGALVRLHHGGQDGQWRLGALEATTDVVTVAGLSDTGTTANDNERRIVISVTGNGSFATTIERSIEAADRGFKASVNCPSPGATDTGTRSVTIDDPDDNIKAYYRVRVNSWSSGVAVVSITYPGGGVTGWGRITGYNSNTSVDFEVLSRLSDTGITDNWQQGYWSDARGYPTAVALHGGRISHAQGGSIFLSVSDDYESFDDTTVGDAGPIIRTLGSGPVDNIYYLISLLRLIIGTAGAEITMRSSSLEEPLTPENSNAGTFGTQGSANLRAVKMDNRALFVQRSRQRLFMVGAGTQGNTFGDYEGFELTLLVPDLLAAGVVSVAVQRQPDTRIHCVLGDGTVAILTYEPQEEVICWQTWSTDGDVEKAMVLPAVSEDAVYYHINRTINGVTKRYLEKWALEADCLGDTGLSWLADCAASFTDTGRSATLTGFSHLAGKSVVVWADDTGQTMAGKDLSPDVSGVQTTYTVDAVAGTIALNEAVHHAVAGLPYTADWKSTKLAYAAEAGTALSQMKRTDKIAFVLYKTHNNGLYFGSDTGNLDPMPRMHEGAIIDPDAIHATYDETAMPFPGLWSADSRIYLRAKAPRPCTVLAAVPSVQTNEKV